MQGSLQAMGTHSMTASSKRLSELTGSARNMLTHRNNRRTMNTRNAIMALAFMIAGAYGDNVNAAVSDLTAASMAALKDMEGEL